MHEGQKLEYAKDITLGLTRMGELKLDPRLIDVLAKVARPVLTRVFPEGIMEGVLFVRPSSKRPVGKPSFD